MKIYDPSDVLTIRQRSIIVGGLLGDANTIRGSWKGRPGNARVRFVHGIAQLDYLKWKYEELREWTGTPIPDIPKTTQFGGQVHSFATLTHPVFSEIYDAIYPQPNGQKRITPQIRAWLDDLALAVWFMDDGSGSYSRARIATYALLPEDLVTMAETFTSTGINCKVTPTTKGPILYFSAAGMRALYARIRPHIHSSLNYKLESEEARLCVICGSPFLARVAIGFPSRTTCSDSCNVKLGHRKRKTPAPLLALR